MKLKALVVAIILSHSPQVLAQTHLVTGTVKDNQSALAGATVVVLGTGIRVVTDYNGDFSLNQLAEGEYRLEISYLGYQKYQQVLKIEGEQRLELGELVLNLDSNTLEVIQVRGAIQRGEMLALNTQKNSNTIINVISASEISKLPDRNAAEAVQRIPGVSIERDQGEGRFVAVRGLPSEWNSATINGNRIPTAEEETTGRSTAFDFFPSEMIEYIEVTKALTPDIEGDAIGGSVNFITRKAAKEQTFSLSAGVGQHAQAQDGLDYTANLLYGDRSADDKFGFIINANIWSRDWATDNYEPRRDQDGGIYRLELRDYTGTRETYGFNGALEYLLDDGKLYASMIYGSLRDDELHYKHRYRFDKDRAEVQHISNELITEMTGFELGGEHFIGEASSIDWQLASYTNEFRYGDTPNGDDASYFVMRFDQQNVGYTGLEDRGEGNNAYNRVDGGQDSANRPDTHLSDDFIMDPAKSMLSWVELYKVNVKERDKIVAQINFNQDISYELNLKLGAKYRNKERNARFSDEFYSWDPSAGPVPTLSDFPLSGQPGGADYLGALNGDYHEQFSPVASLPELADFWTQNRDNFILDESESLLVSNGGALGRHFDVNETHISAYAMASYEFNDMWFVMGGLRLTQTDTEVKGYTYIADEDALVASKGGKDYLSVLPSLHVKYSPDEMTNYRLALTRGFSRPDFGALSPGSTYFEADNELNTGNPELEPTYSNNLDLMAEYYFDNVGLISAGFFYKDIQDPIFEHTSIGEYKGKTGVLINRPENGDDARLYGAELSLSQSLDFISDSLESFGILANYTLMDSEMTVPGREEKTKIPRQADRLYNLTVYYDDDTFSLRVAMNYKGEYIESHGRRSDSDRYYGSYQSLDMSASYNLSKRASVYLEMNNLTDEPLTYYQGSPARPLQVEYYGVRGMLGFSYGF
ncbi:TonB-dependent receptor [Shewanella psychropiezotolerans]|uniref:TonB-dependent receptor n=1 Tax=Shewanella psychropiezotolerans TaxID=2593655 RepID=A0ABX5WVX8_9GAMM|nr:TonB-dependent receptor [Shewanella psychropiezotolerans]QDO83088.1 TonB-dependent receptor [Shewanella psychropiezotolerans]